MQEDFRRLVKKSTYQAFLLSSPCSLPIIGVHHLWFVVNKKGKLSRWEVLFRKHLNKTSWGYLHLNYSPPFQGIEIIPYMKRYFWSSELIGVVEGNEAKKLIKTIENSKKYYPYTNNYHFLGPNSNTYIQWILNQHPKTKLKAAHKALGIAWKEA